MSKLVESQNTQNERKRQQNLLATSSTSDPCEIKLDIVLLLYPPLSSFKNHLVPYVIGEFNSNNSLCPSKESTDHKLSICSPHWQITNDLSIYSDAILDELC